MLSRAASAVPRWFQRVILGAGPSGGMALAVPSRFRTLQAVSSPHPTVGPTVRLGRFPLRRKGGSISAANRRAAKAALAPDLFAGSILDMMDAAGFVGPTWEAWRSLWRAVYALRMESTGQKRFTRHTGRSILPPAPVREGWLIVGRRGGKSRMGALVALFQGIRRDLSAVAGWDNAWPPATSITVTWSVTATGRNSTTQCAEDALFRRVQATGRISRRRAAAGWPST